MRIDHALYEDDFADIRDEDFFSDKQVLLDGKA